MVPSVRMFLLTHDVVTQNVTNALKHCDSLVVSMAVSLMRLRVVHFCVANADLCIMLPPSMNVHMLCTGSPCCMWLLLLTQSKP